MKNDELAILADFLWKREIQSFVSRVYLELDSHFMNNKSLQKELTFEETYIEVSQKLMKENHDKPFLITVFDEIFEFYTKDLNAEFLQHVKHEPF